jgi:hypothetical protein
VIIGCRALRAADERHLRCRERFRGSSGADGPSNHARFLREQ